MVCATQSAGSVSIYGFLASPIIVILNLWPVKTSSSSRWHSLACTLLFRNSPTCLWQLWVIFITSLFQLLTVAENISNYGILDIFLQDFMFTRLNPDVKMSWMLCLCLLSLLSSLCQVLYAQLSSSGTSTGKFFMPHVKCSLGVLHLWLFVISPNSDDSSSFCQGGCTKFCQSLSNICQFEKFDVNLFKNEANTVHLKLHRSTEEVPLQNTVIC